jgi:hypothetical protein
VIFTYNAATSYALAIGHLSDRLRGGGPFATPWPTEEKPLDRKGRKELQRSCCSAASRSARPMA